VIEYMGSVRQKAFSFLPLFYFYFYFFLSEYFRDGGNMHLVGHVVLLNLVLVKLAFAVKTCLERS